MNTKRLFGELEISILKIFKKKEKMTVRAVLNALGGKDKYTTIMTVMHRLTEKNLLIRQRKGQHYEYWLNESNKNSSSSLLNKLKEKFFGGSSASMASYLIESEEISDSELAQIETLIKEIQSTRKKP